MSAEDSFRNSEQGGGLRPQERQRRGPFAANKIVAIISEIEERRCRLSRYLPTPVKVLPASCIHVAICLHLHSGLVQVYQFSFQTKKKAAPTCIRPGSFDPRGQFPPYFTRSWSAELHRCSCDRHFTASRSKRVSCLHVTVRPNPGISDVGSRVTMSHVMIGVCASMLFTADKSLLPLLATYIPGFMNLTNKELFCDFPPVPIKPSL